MHMFSPRWTNRALSILSPSQTSGLVQLPKRAQTFGVLFQAWVNKPGFVDSRMGYCVKLVCVDENDHADPGVD